MYIQLIKKPADPDRRKVWTSNNMYFIIDTDGGFSNKIIKEYYYNSLSILFSFGNSKGQACFFPLEACI